MVLYTRRKVRDMSSLDSRLLSADGTIGLIGRAIAVLAPKSQLRWPKCWRAPIWLAYFPLLPALVVMRAPLQSKRRATAVPLPSRIVSVPLDLELNQ